MDYIAFCRSFFVATGIPVNLLKKGTPIYSSLGEVTGYQVFQNWPVYPAEKNPEFSSINPDLEYGHVHIENTDYDLFIGPIFTVPATEELIREFFVETKTPPEYREAFSELLYNIPVDGHPRFLRVLAFLHRCLNHKEADMDGFYLEKEEISRNRNKREIKESVDAKENERSISSYSFERELYHWIAEGNPARLKKFFETTKEFPPEGQMARTPLRQAKNIFIAFAAKAGVLGAIAGGVEEDRVYQLVNLYILDCEQTQTIEEVHRLQYVFTMDLCQRVGEAKRPKGVSEEVYQCMNYIERNTNRQISVEEIARKVHRSPSYVMKHFKDETGMSVGAYIAKCKLGEAKDLLIYGDRSLAEISNYLGYSSQSYFQNVFKKEFGMTPMQFRRENRKQQ